MPLTFQEYIFITLIIANFYLIVYDNEVSVYFSDLDHAIFFTLCYSDYFNFPLNKEEIYQRLPKVWDWPFLTGSKLKSNKLNFEINKSNFERSLEKLEKTQKIKQLVKDKKIYYFLNGRQNLVKLRISKEKIAKKRQPTINQTSNWLQRFSTIKAIALTGSSSLNNASLNDDFDFCLIVRKNTLWISRFFVILLAKVLGKQPQIDAQAKNDNKQAWCFNLWLDESSLNIVNRGFSIYQAYELIQMRWLVDKGGFKEKILAQNQQLTDLINIDNSKQTSINSQNTTVDYLLWPINLILYFFQKVYRFFVFGKEDFFLNKHQAHFNEYGRQKSIFREVKKKMRANAFSDL